MTAGIHDSLLLFILKSAHLCWDVERDILSQKYKSGQSQMNRDSIITSLSALEKKIQSIRSEVTLILDKVACSVRYRRNMMVATNGLPNELLCNIFTEASNGDYAKSMVFSHVCSHWRTVSLHYPLLWRRLEFPETTPLALVECMFDRVKDTMPLRVAHTGSMHDNMVGFLALCARYLSNISDMELFVKNANLLNKAEYLFPARASMLRHLKIEALKSKMDIIVPPLLREGASNLNDLTMINCRLSWAACRYDGLAKLTISCDNPHQESELDTDILDLLRGCPALEELHLKYRGFPLGSIPATELIPLTRLHTLKLNGLYPDIAYILEHVETMPFLSLICSCEDDRIDSQKSLIPRDSRCLPVINEIRSLTITLCSCSDPQHVLSGSSSTSNTASDLGSFLIQYVDMDGEPTLIELMSAVIAHYPLKNLEELQLISADPGDFAYYPIAFRSLISLMRHTFFVTRFILTDLHLSDDEVWAVLVSEHSASSLPLFPKLEQFTVTRMTINEEFCCFLKAWKPSVASFRHLCLQQCEFAPPETRNVICELAKELVIELIIEEVH